MKHAALCVVIVFVGGTLVWSGGDDELRILTFPIGLVTGEVPVDVDLGPSQAPAALYLDGERVCSLSAAATRCVVDLGEAPHVHLLELLRRDSEGRAIARASRWVNRPGQEAEVALLLAPRSADSICGGRLLFSHPLKQEPIMFSVEQNGRGLRVGDDGRSFRFPCPDVSEPHLITASAVFPDGARAETVALAGGFGQSTDAGLSSVSLVDEGSSPGSCGTLAQSLGPAAIAAEDPPFEVVFVLDPRAGYRTLLASGWNSASWTRAFSTLHPAAALWYVVPDPDLSRISGLGEGRERWLRNLFATGAQKVPGDPRLADAVAASGLVAAAGSRRRAVVLLLGGRPVDDVSAFTPDQAQAYLAEVGVPLVVLRNGRRLDDGWPDGVPVFNMEAFADALEDLRETLERQCIVWLPNDLEPRELAALLPPTVAIAGRGSDGSSGEGAWRQAEQVAESGPEAGVGDGRPARGQIEVTAATVLLRAVDGHGHAIDDLAATDLAVLEDGGPASVLSLERIAPRSEEAADDAIAEAEEVATVEAQTALPVVVYVDSRLAGAASTSASLRQLVPRSEWMTSLGPVDVVVAGDEVATVLEGSRDAGAVRTALESEAAKTGGWHAVDLIRSRFVREIRQLPKRADGSGAPPGGGRMNVLVAARSAIAEENATIAITTTRLRAWAGEAGSSDPRLLLLVGTAFDEDPREFYLPFVERLEPMNVARASEEFRDPARAQMVELLGRDLAASGWTVIPVGASTLGAGASSVSADISGSNRFQAFMSAASDAVLTPSEGWLQVDPLAAQRHVALPSGGTVALGEDGLDSVIESSAGWYRLTYQVDRVPDGAAHELVISCTRPEVDARSTAVIFSGTSEDRAAFRLRRLLAGEALVGDLRVTLDVSAPTPVGGGRRQAEVAAVVDLGPLVEITARGRDRRFRVSVAVDAGEPQPFLNHSTASVASGVVTWEFGFPLVSPSGSARLVVSVEDLATGFWGAATGNLPG